MKNLTLIIFILISVYQFSFANNINMRTQEFPKKEMKSQNKEIAKLVSDEISKTLPQTIDKYTTLTSISAKNTTLIYTFEINTGAKSDKTVKNEDRTRMKKAVTKGVCQSSSKFLEVGINTSYLYISSTSKALLFQFDISQDDCIKIIN